MGKTIRIAIIAWFLLCMPGALLAQFEPAAGLAGTSAIHKDSSIFSGWANQCRVQSGPMDCMNPTLGLCGPNDSSMTFGLADGVGVVSLGDGGSATLQFPYPITNGPGPDFAVFENGFSDDFLEFAFVEVSSNGIDFFRFPATSLIDTLNQTGTFGLSQPEKINNLAGKYRVFYGTPFDLEDLDTVLNLDLQRITHIKIVDVVGCLQCESYSSRDAQGNLVNDPYPTPFPQGGFDLDAVGVIHFAPAGLNHAESLHTLNVYPNPLPAGGIGYWGTDPNDYEDVELLDKEGRCVASIQHHQGQFQLPELSPGVYLLRAKTNSEQKILHQKIIISP